MSSQPTSNCGDHGPWLTRLVPALDWLRHYERKQLPGDALAGGIVATLLIPQGMAYALLAGLPPQFGLYASLLPLAAYALLGSSRFVAVGPVAMVSLLVANGVAPLAPAGSAELLGLALTLALMVGALQLAMGLARMGFLTSLLSHPVLSGFTSAAALIIAASQLKHLFGVAAIRERKKIDLAVELTEWEDGREYDRLGLEEEKYAILGLEIPLLRIPVRPGRNMTTIVEVAARNQLLKEMGYHSALEFQDRLEKRMAETAWLHAHSIIGDNLE